MRKPRVAVLSVHTSPMDQPGSGDSGGMNVYIRAVAERLAEHEVEVDLFTRCRGADGPEILEIGAGVRLVTLKAGPCAPVPKTDLPRFLPEFLGGVLRRARVDGQGYDILHSHYWLSGWVGNSAKDILGLPLVASFHTLGKVKNYSLARGEAPEPPSRLVGEERVIAGADRILAPTPAEAAQLVGLYRADPGSHPDRAARCGPLDLLPARPRGRSRPAPSHGPPVGAVRRASPGAQRTRRRGADARGGGRAGPGAHAGPDARDRGWSERDGAGRRGRPADGAGRGARRERAGDALPSVAPGAPGRRVRRRGRRAGAIPVGVLRPGGAGGAGLRRRLSSRPPSAGCGSSSTTTGRGSWSRATTPRITRIGCSRYCGIRRSPSVWASRPPVSRCGSRGTPLRPSSPASIESC